MRRVISCLLYSVLSMLVVAVILGLCSLMLNGLTNVLGEVGTMVSTALVLFVVIFFLHYNDEDTPGL